ncbi:MAG: hypothetical protein J0H75_08250, partial [Rhizobiales bacterium]|nr:hypothetical protein [Hyphomicrobiales bacterium]
SLIVSLARGGSDLLLRTNQQASCADLIRASIFRKAMDCRVKPGNDASKCSIEKRSDKVGREAGFKRIAVRPIMPPMICSIRGPSFA